MTDAVSASLRNGWRRPPEEQRRLSSSTHGPGRHTWSFWPPAFLITMTLPASVSVLVFGFLVTPYRVLSISAAIAVVSELFRRRNFAYELADYFVIFYAILGAVAYFANVGWEISYQSAVVMGLESVVPYFIARLFVTDMTGLQKLARLAMIIVWCLLPFAIIEAVTRVYLLPTLLDDWAGVPTGPATIRMGLLRAMTIFDHPILYGTFCASIFSLVWYLMPRRGRALRSAVIVLSVFLSGSSGAYVGIAIQAVLIVWERLTQRLRKRWTFLLALTIAGLIAISLLSNRSLFAIVVTYMTLDPHTGWTRVAQWNYGWQDVAQHWVVGLGGTDWARPKWLFSSIDNFWLYIALNFGVPGLLASVGCVAGSLYAAFGPNGAGRTNQAYRAALQAWAFTIVTLSIVGFTVHYWKGMHALFFFLLGLGPLFGQVPRATKESGNGISR